MKKDLTRSLMLHKLPLVAGVVVLVAASSTFADSSGRNQRQGPPRGQGQGQNQQQPPAPDCPPGGHVVGPGLGQLLHQLNLSKEQCDKIVPVLEAERAKIEAIFAQQGIQPGQRPTREQMEAMKDKIQPIHQATRAAIEAVLTQQQSQKLSELESQICSNSEPPQDDSYGNS